ncbi:MAG TPA: twin-arginine translocase subunit TatC [Gemmatimonadales bacterium]|nr:twin-arginine translocase subunit TatC [Gemmatimonadales bacterium]
MSRAQREPDRGEMPFLDHLEELRWRIIWSLIAVTVGIGLALIVLLRVNVIGWLEQPILPYLGGHHLVFTHPGDPFQIILEASAGLGILLALPVILYQLWAFVAPALYRHERSVAIGVAAGAVFLFLCGVSLGYFVVLPLAIPWLMGFGGAALEPMITAGEYFGFVFSLTLAFGVAFELPVVILGLAALGIVTPEFLNRYRRHAIVAAVIIGAFLTPGDLVWTTVAMAVPLYLLYELSIALSYVVRRRRLRREAERQAEEAAASSAGSLINGSANP